MMTPTTIATVTTATTTGRWTIDGTVGHGDLEGLSRQIRSTQRYGHGGLGRFGKLDECISCRLILSPVISRSWSRFYDFMIIIIIKMNTKKFVCKNSCYHGSVVFANDVVETNETYPANRKLVIWPQVLKKAEMTRLGSSLGMLDTYTVRLAICCWCNREWCVMLRTDRLDNLCEWMDGWMMDIWSAVDDVGCYVTVVLLYVVFWLSTK